MNECFLVYISERDLYGDPFCHNNVESEVKEGGTGKSQSLSLGVGGLGKAPSYISWVNISITSITRVNALSNPKRKVTK